MNFLYKAFCSVLGIGYIPFAPGTFGSIAGLTSAWLIMQYSGNPNLNLALLIVMITFTGAFFSNKLVPVWGTDPKRIVVDEVAGMWITLLFIPPQAVNFILAFILFRLLDIFKPFIIRRFEKFPGGWGIMLDDIAAGVAGNIILHFIIWIRHAI